MSRYRIVKVKTPTIFHALILDEETTEGWQMYSWGGWLRRTTGWILENTEPVDDATAMRLVEELRGRGMEMIANDFEMEAQNE